MRRITLLALFFISTACLAESGAYRVELIVFENIDSTAEPRTADTLRSFSRFPGPPPPVPETPAENDAETPLPGPVPLLFSGQLPDQFEFIDGRSDYMNDVWRRLRASKAYRPLLWTAWQQNRIDYYPPVRVHDEQLIDRQFRPSDGKLLVDLTAADPLFLYRSEFYQLDGSVQLRRSRFLHVYLDLEYRQGFSPRLPVEDTEGDLNDDLINTIEDSYTGPVDEAYKLHHLKQNRQIQTGKLNFFDTPALGVLVFVTAVSG
jgi:hypothetical protein